jgi:hypothetical protein
MAANLTTVNNILKEYYLGPVQEQLNNEVLLISRLEARSEDLVGKAAFIPLHTGRSSGIGAIAESAILPTAGNQSYDRAEYDLKYLYGRVQVTGPSMAKTKSDAGSFLQILRSELDGIRNDLKKDLARQSYGKGDGVIASCGSSSITPNGSQTSGTDIVITLSDWEPLRKGQIYTNMVVDLVTYSAGAPTVVATAVAVKSTSLVAATTSTVTLTLNATVTVPTGTASITRTGVVGTFNRWALAQRSMEIDGLQRIVTSVTPTDNTSAPYTTEAKSGTLGKIDAYAKDFWDNQRTFGATPGTLEPLTLQRVQQAMNLSRTKAGNPTVLLTSLGVLREFYRLLTITQQFISNEGTMDFKAGFQTISYNGVPVVGDIDAPYGKMYVLDESTLKVFSDQDWHFLDADGQTLRQVPNYDAFEAVLARYMNLGATNRAKNVVINDISVNGTTTADIGV